MANDYIYLNKKRVSFDDIKSGAAGSESSFEKTTLLFCQQWLSGMALFSINTSGSTGEPKTISVSRQQMQKSAQQTIGFFNITSTDTILVCLNTAYIAGIMMLVRGLESGAKIIVTEPSGNPLLDLAKKVDFLAVVPLQLQRILDEPQTKIKLENCRASIVGGAPISVKLEEKIKNSSATVFATFAMTETLTHFAIKQLNPSKDDGYTVLNGSIIGQDSRGCLTITSPVTNNQKIVSNDLIELLSVDSFKWQGRIDNVINSGGVKIQIESLEKKIEYIFHSLNINKRFFVGSVEDDVLGDRIVLYLESDKIVLEADKSSWFSSLDAFEKPKEVIAIQRFIETPTGKINRQTTANLS